MIDPTYAIFPSWTNLICLNTEENYLPLLLIKIWHYCHGVNSAAKRNRNELRYFPTIDADVNKFKIILYVTIVFVVVIMYPFLLKYTHFGTNVVYSMCEKRW